MAKQKDSESNPLVHPDAPPYLSPEWHDYVMKHFQPDELIDGNPLTAGLRRVAELLLGDIISSKPIEVKPVEGNGVGRATVVYEVQFQWKLDGSGGVRVYADVADTWIGNTDDLFCVHAPATAATRAEGRALRKALKIRALAAEELTKKDVSKHLADNETLPEGHEKIVKDQINFIITKCKKLNLDVMKFINSGEHEYASIEAVTKHKALKMIERLKEFTRDKDLIDDSIKGYNDSWSEK